TLAAPSPLIWIILGRVTWNTFIGIINGVLIFAFGFAWFRTGVSLVNPPLFVLASIATFVSLSAFGLMLSSVYVLSRKGGFIENSMEIPIYIATGTMFPIALLPFFVQPISFIIGPTWGIEAIRISALSGYVGLTTGYWFDMLILLVETVLYFALCFWLFVKVEAVAKRNGTIEEY
ncbi:MAG: ABC transporter permease, partial [Nitrososphaerales archaeon]